MEISEVEPSLTPSMDIQVSSNFERLLFDLFERDGRAAARKRWQRFRRAGTTRRVDARSTRAVRAVRAGTARRSGTLAVMARCSTANRRTDRSAQRDRRRGGRAMAAPRTSPMVALATAHPAKFPDAVEQRHRRRRRAAAALADLLRPARALRCAAQRSRAPCKSASSAATAAAGAGAHERTRSPACQRAPRRDRPHGFGRDRLARRLGRRRHAQRAGGDQRRRAPAGAHGVQGHDAALRPRHRRGDRGGRRPPQRLYRARADRLLRQGAEGRCAARRRYPRRHPAALRCSMPRSWRASAASCSRRSARPRTRPTTSSSIISRRPRFPIRRWAARCSARPKSSRDLPRDAVATTCAALRASAHGAGRRRRRSITTSWSSLRSRPSADLPPRRAASAEPARYTAATSARRARPRAGASRARLSRRRLSRSRLSTPLQVLSTVLGGGMSSRLFQEIREKRGLVYTHLHLRRALIAMAACSASMPAPARRTTAGVDACRSSPRRCERLPASGQRRSSHAPEPRSKAGMLIGTGINLQSRCEQIASTSSDLWPADVDRGDSSRASMPSIRNSGGRVARRS